MTAWPTARLSELGKVDTGSTPDTTDPSLFGGETPFVTPSDLDVIGPVVTASRSLSASGLESARLIQADAVLVCCIGSLGKVGIAGRPVAANQQINSVTFDPARIWPRFGYHACRRLKTRMQEVAPATTVPIINKSRFGALEIPVPPLVDQRRIADILDRADAVRAKRREAIGLADGLGAAAFAQLFGDVLLNDRRWPAGQTLGDVADVASGVTKGRNLVGVSTREVPYLAVSNVQDMRLNLSVVKTIPASEEEIARYRLQAGDIVLTEGGDPDKLGRGTLWRSELTECIHQNHVFRVRVTAAGIQPLFLNWLLSSARGKRYFLRSAKQTTGIASINMTQLKGFPILLPPGGLQREFAERIAAVDKLKAAHRSSLAEMDALFASLQHRAFRGEL